MAVIVSGVADNETGLLRAPTKTITFTGAAGAGAVGTVALWTIAGVVEVVSGPFARCTTSLTGATATVALGITGQTSLWIGATTATGITTSAEWWLSTTPTAAGILVPAALKEVVIDANVIITVATAAVASGVMTFDCFYRPLSSGASLS